MDSYLWIPFVCVLYFFAADGEGAVTGPDVLVTNGTRDLRLTCVVANSSSVDRYAWFTPLPNTNRCVKSSDGTECTFTPTLEDDTKNVTCRALDSNSFTLAVATYTVNLKYPPQVPPVITQKKEIKCTVAGGKPLVMNVTFHCQTHLFPDEEDHVSNETRTVSSLITEANATSLNCACFAYWAPEPGLYPDISYMRVDLKKFLRDTSSTASWVGAGATVFVAAILSICAIQGC
ncbi:uncharacterized protein [Littorina saxatilis]|uniref:Ig-like domain-containing protein n=1 Tax=Littorina saxatilis TaxID=31220 RepID=A0AAN9BJ20_9CAEN